MLRRAARITLFTLTLASVAASLHLACTGSDPSFSPTPATNGTGDAQANPAASRSTLGVFLTSSTYPTDFAKDVAPNAIQKFVDDICQAHAADAGVAHAEDYSAAIAVDSSGLTTLNQVLSVAVVDASAPVWCALTATDPPAVGCDVLGTVFTQANDFATGPKATIFTNERGLAAPIKIFNTPFFLSGVYIPSNPDGGGGFQAGSIVNCDQWRNRLPESFHSDGGSHELEPTYGFGYGDPSAVGEGALQFQWLGNTFAYCEQRFELPLLCIERPR